MSATAAVARPRQAARLRLPERARRWLIGGAAIVVALVAWQLVVGAGLIKAAYAGTPATVLGAGWTMLTDGELVTNGVPSLIAFVVGFGLSVVVGVPLGLAMGWNRTVRQLVQPPIMALYVTPRLALLPVIVVWLGIGVRTAIVVILIGAMIPIIVNAMAGVRDVDAKLVQVARSFGASRLDLFRKILLPSATPLILSGIRLAVGSAVLGVVISELYVSIQGIGRLISAYGQVYQTNYIVFLVLLVGTFGWAVTALVRLVERRVERWRGA